MVAIKVKGVRRALPKSSDGSEVQSALIFTFVMPEPVEDVKLVMVPTKAEVSVASPISVRVIVPVDVSKTRLNRSLSKFAASATPVVLKLLPLVATVPAQVPAPHEKSSESALALGARDIAKISPIPARNKPLKTF